MNFISTQQKLNFCLKLIDKIIVKNLTLPILQNTLISCEQKNNSVALKATDLEVGLEVLIPAKVEKEGSVTIPTKVFSSFVGSLPDKNIEVTVEGNKASIKCADYKANIKGESPNDFPIIPIGAMDNLFSIKNEMFLTGISSVINCSSTLDIKPELSGVYIAIQNDKVVFASTDSFRLAEKKSYIENKKKYASNFILPKRVCDLIIRIFENFNGFIELGLESDQVVIHAKPEDSLGVDVRFVGRIIDGDYPKYEQIIPQKFTTTVSVSRKDLIQHIKSASLFSNKINEITVLTDIEKQELIITSNNNEYGDHQSVIKCNITGGERVSLVFNHQYILDGLSGIESPEVSLKINQSNTPVLIESQDDNSFKYLVMPIKT